MFNFFIPITLKYIQVNATISGKEPSWREIIVSQNGFISENEFNSQTGLVRMRIIYANGDVEYCYRSNVDGKSYWSKIYYGADKI